MRLIDSDTLGVGRCSKDILPDAYCAGWNGLIELIEKAPTIDAVPVVRCRECKHRKYDDIFGMIWCNRASCTKRVKPDDFCSYGEKRRGKDGTT